MPDGLRPSSAKSSRDLPANMADRLIVALDVPTIQEANALVEKLDGVVSFYKIGLWLAYVEGADRLIATLIQAGKKVFLDTKMFDIGQTVEEGVARAADRGVSFVTVHGDGQIIRSAVKGKRGSALKIFSVTVLTSLSDADLFSMGYRLTAQELVHLRVTEAIKYGCDGIIASAHDNPDEIRRIAGSESLLIATPGIRPQGDTADDHQRSATPADAIAKGADYLVVGRPIIGKADPNGEARRIVDEMITGAKSRQTAS